MKFKVLEKNNFFKKGFTLIELLVVIAIIGILASVVSVSLNNSKAKARDAIRATDLNNIADAIELYFSENHRLPNSSDNDFTKIFTGGSLPKDPKTNLDYAYEKNYSPISYCLGAKMELESSENNINCLIGSETEEYRYQIQGP